MSALSRLWKVGSMAGSMGVYVPAVAFQRAIALGRLLLFLHLLSRLQYGLWGLGAMIFSVGASVATLGTHLALARYVSFYEARGLLEQFYRRLRWAVLAVAVSATALGLLASGVLTDVLIVSRQVVADVARQDQLYVCWAALLNAMLMALYHNLQSFVAGMRAYRLASAVEIAYTILFTAFGAAALLIAPTALSALIAHAAALLVALLIAASMLQYGLGRFQHLPPPPRPTPDEAPVMEPSDETAEMTAPVAIQPTSQQPPADLTDALPRVLRYGLAALLGSLLWLAAGYVSFYMISRGLGKAEAGGFYAFLQIGQFTVYLANAAWAVVFAHVARRWESGDRQTALFVFQTAYKAVAMAVMTLTLLVYAASGLWIHLLPTAYQEGLPLLGGLLMFFQVVTHLALITMLANLHRRPIITALVALVGGGANAVLVWHWLPTLGSQGAAWAAGIGMYAGGGLVTMAYLAATRVKLDLSVLVVFVSPGLLLLLSLPVWYLAAVAWAGLLLVAFTTERMFSGRQKRILKSYLVTASKVLLGKRK